MFSSLRGLWSRHKRKILVSLGLVGSGYLMYKFYDLHRRRILEVERQIEGAKEVDELVKNQLQMLFENIQKVADTTTLPYTMHNLRSIISEELDISHLTEKLQGKGQANPVTSQEKRNLWQRLKVLSFTRTASSLWSMTILYLYVRVQVNILGRQLYLEIAHTESFGTLDESDTFSRHGQQDFLETAEYLSTYGISSLMMNMQIAAEEALKDQQLTEPFSISRLRETMMQILELFMSIGEPNYWISYLIPENANDYRQQLAMSANGFDDSSILMDATRLEQLMLETRAVLSSPEFRSILEASLKKVVDLLIEDFNMHVRGTSFSEIPLAKLLPRVTELGIPLLDEPRSNKFVQAIGSLQEVELFYTLLYTKMSEVR